MEFRRTRPRVDYGHPVILYASTPVMGIVGVGYVERVVSAPPTRLWETYRGEGGITRERFRTYFRGATQAHGIVLSRVTSLCDAVELSTIRDKLPSFHPPQAFRYLNHADVTSLGLAV